MAAKYFQVMNYDWWWQSVGLERSVVVEHQKKATKKNVGKVPSYYFYLQLHNRPKPRSQASMIWRKIAAVIVLRFFHKARQSIGRRWLISREKYAIIDIPGKDRVWKLSSVSSDHIKMPWVNFVGKEHQVSEHNEAKASILHQETMDNMHHLNE